MQWQTELPLIAILRGITPGEALAHVGAVIDAGFDAVEIPLNSPEWEKSIPAIVKAFGDKALIGAGTVLQPEQVDELAKMGCKLIVTPNMNPEVIRRAVEYGMTRLPGLRHGYRSLCRPRCRRTVSQNFPVVGLWSGLHQSAESGLTRQRAGLCRGRRHAGKPGAVDKSGLCGRRAGQRSLSCRTAR